jgi:hypothetical protein
MENKAILDLSTISLRKQFALEHMAFYATLTVTFNLNFSTVYSFNKMKHQPSNVHLNFKKNNQTRGPQNRLIRRRSYILIYLTLF